MEILKRIKWIVGLAVIFGICAVGCGIEGKTDDSANSGDVAVVTETTDISASDDATLTPEDIKTFIFEGKEYSLPVDYDAIIDKGWRISDESYAAYKKEEEKPAGELFMVSDDYPEVIMSIGVKLDLSMNVPESLEGIVAELRDNGIRSIDIYPKGEPEDVSVYPEYSVKGITFGSSSKDIVETFGKPDDEFSVEGEEYCYFAHPSNNPLDVKSLQFYLKDDSVYHIYLSY